MKRKTAAALLVIFLLGLTGCAGNGTKSEQAGTDGSPVSERTEDAGRAGTDDSTEEAGGSGKTPESDDGYSDLDISFNTYMEARFSEDEKTAYIPFGNGACVEIHDEEGITFAAATPNRKRLVVLLKNDELYVTDLWQKEKEVLSKNCSSSRVYPSDEGLGFQESDGDEKHLILYTFADGALTDLGACDDGLISENRTAAVSVKGDSLYLYGEGFDGIRSYVRAGSGEPNLVGISDDGSTVIWTEETDQYLTETLYTVGADGTVQPIGDIQVRGFVHAAFSRDGKLALITSDQVNRLFLKDVSGQWMCVELPGDLKNETGVYETDAGLLNEVNADEIHFLYLRCGTQLCAVSVDGAVTVIQNSVRDFDIVDGILYYSDAQKNIYAAGLDGASVSESILLLSGPDTFAVSPDGQYLYGMDVHEDNEKIRSLSVYPLHKENAEATVLSENLYADAHVYLSSEESRVFYLEDVVETDDTYYYIGTLKMYDAESGETKTIDTDVFKNTFVNGKTYVLVSEYAQSMAGTGKFVTFHGNLTYRKKPESETNGSRFDWYSYDGLESMLMASGLKN